MKITVEFESDSNLIDDFSYEFNLMVALRETFKSFKILNTMPSGFITFDSIEKAVCKHTGVTPDEIQHKKRFRKVVEARQICHYLARNNNLGTLSAIAFRFGRKDHSTCLHSCDTVEMFLGTDKEYQLKYKSFIQSFLYPYKFKPC